MTSKGAALAAEALERMRREIEGMDAQVLAKWATRPALKLLVETVADPTYPIGVRMTAASHLLAAGWHKAPATALNFNANYDGTEAVAVTPEMIVELARSTLARAQAAPAAAAGLEVVEMPP